MKKQFLMLAVIICAAATIVSAQTPTVPPPPPHMSSTFIKDPGIGSRVNVGVTFAPTISWMYDHTPGYQKDGVVAGMRYGVNLNVNLTRRKNFYFSTGIFAEHCGGKMMFVDNVPIGALGIVDSTPTRRTYRSIYLTIPTAITMKTNSINNFFICGNIGLMHSVNLHATSTDKYVLGGEVWSREKKDSQEAAMFKEAFFLGTGFEYSLTANTRVGVMVNYVQSFTNYFKGKGKAQNSYSGVDQRANLGYVEVAFNINFF